MVFRHWACGKQAGLVADLGMAFVDDWVRGTDMGMTLIEAPRSSMTYVKMQSPMVQGIVKVLGSLHFYGRWMVEW